MFYYDNPKAARFSAKDAVKLYIENGDKIFDSSIRHKIVTFDGILGEKHEKKGIDGCLRKYFGNLKLSQLLKPCIITSYDIERRKTKSLLNRIMHYGGIWRIFC